MPNPPGMSPKDGNQVLRAVMDDDNNRLRVDAVISPDGHDLEIHYQDDSIAIGDPATDNILHINGDGSLNVDATVSNTVSVIGPLTNTELRASPVEISGEVTADPAGLKTGLATNQLTITDVAQKVPISDLLNRNTISIRVLGFNRVFFGNSSVTVLTGYPKYQYEEIVMDVQDKPAVDIWAVCEPGSSCLVAVMEIA